MGPSPMHQPSGPWAQVLSHRLRRAIPGLLVVAALLCLAARWSAAAEPAAQPKDASTGASDTDSVSRSLGGTASSSKASAAPTLGSLAKGSTSLFGLTGEGNSFVYVFDRSGSMGGSGHAALAAAKRELLASLENLDGTQRFQIIFYNETPVLFNPTGQAGRLAFATESTKQHARRFIEAIAAEGGTQHEEALKMAIRLRPDVIFFLTDAGDPELKPEQLKQIRRWAVGIKLNVIEFGQGPQPDGDNFLKKLARENDGQYTYVDISADHHGPRM